jgi:hypothetical protein
VIVHQGEKGLAALEQVAGGNRRPIAALMND